MVSTDGPRSYAPKVLIEVCDFTVPKVWHENKMVATDIITLSVLFACNSTVSNHSMTKRSLNNRLGRLLVSAPRMFEAL